MDRFFGSPYRGDAGIPHSGGAVFWVLWGGCAAFSASLLVRPYLSDPNKAMLHEQYRRRKAVEKKENYDSVWDSMGRRFRESYDFNWPVYFP